MNIGIVGTGLIGGTLARQFARAGHQVMISFSKTEGKLLAIAGEIGINIVTGSPAEALAFGDVTILSVHFTAMDIAIEQMGFVDNKIVIDTSNQYDIVLQEGTTAASEVQRRLLGARLVKAFNTLNYADLLTRAFHVPLYVIPYSGDDSEANARTANLIASIGFEPFYTGTLSKVAAQELHGPLAGKLLTVEQAKNLLWDAQ